MVVQFLAGFRRFQRSGSCSARTAMNLASSGVTCLVNSPTPERLPCTTADLRSTCRPMAAGSSHSPNGKLIFSLGDIRKHSAGLRMFVPSPKEVGIQRIGLRFNTRIRAPKPVL